MPLIYLRPVARLALRFASRRLLLLHRVYLFFLAQVLFAFCFLVLRLALFLAPYLASLFCGAFCAVFLIKDILNIGAA